MRNIFILLILGIAIQGNAQFLPNNVAILPSDTKEDIIRRAVHVGPTPNQYEALKQEFIAFIHMGPNTFTRMEWGDGMEDPAIFDLKTLDTDQWCEAMAAAGMKMVILTVKHHDGFVLWQSRYTDHGIMSTGFQEGKGDILKDLSRSCEKYGLKLGIYLSPADLFQIENPEGLYGNGSTYSMRTIPREVPGRPFTNTKKFEFWADDYNEYFLNQLYELLTEYGPVHELWFDGAHPKRKGNQQYNYHAWKELIRTLAPEAVIFGREDIRWCGNESGDTRDTEWNVIPYAFNPDTTGRFPDMTATDLGSRAQLYQGNFLHYQPAETNTSIREGWFYRDDVYQKVRSADDVFDIYERSVGGNSIFLLNIPPNRDGRFSDEDVRVLEEVGKRIKETYTHNLFASAKGKKKVLDANPETFVVLKKNKKELIIKTKKLVTINRIMLQESITTHGERVEKHAVDAWIDGKWQEIAEASNIGYKRILRFPEITSNKFRLRVLESRLDPAIGTFAAYFYDTRPPQLEIFRNSDGQVVIQPKQAAFNWKPHSEDISDNLYKNLIIRYTTDGSQPNHSSPIYSEPFVLNKGQVNAVAFMNDKTGAVAEEELGIPKMNWRIADMSSEVRNYTASNAIDENTQTYWISKKGNPNHYLKIDLGKTYTIQAFAYTPQQQNSSGMMAKGYVEVSKDGNEWTKAGDFEFGNLINDPSRRKYRFNQALEARFVRIIATDIAEENNILTIAELNIYEN